MSCEHRSASTRAPFQPSVTSRWSSSAASGRALRRRQGRICEGLGERFEEIGGSPREPLRRWLMSAVRLLHGRQGVIEGAASLTVNRKGCWQRLLQRLLQAPM